MAIRITVQRQRIPMIDASTLDDRTQPVPDQFGPFATRLRYFE